MANEFIVRKGLIVLAGQNQITNSLAVSGHITAPAVTSSLYGTASWAVSSSWASSSPTASYFSGSTLYLQSQGADNGGILYIGTGADWNFARIQGDSSNLQISASGINLISPIITATNLTASLFGTASQAVSASFAPVTTPDTSVSASWASSSLSSSYLGVVTGSQKWQVYVNQTNGNFIIELV